MELGLEGKRALVTGSTAGIGLAIARGLAREGAHVWVNGRTRERVDLAVAAVKGSADALAAAGAPVNAGVRGIVADLSTAAGADALLAELPEVDVLVNNLGIFEAKPFEQIPDADWSRFFETNVMSGVRLSRAYLPAMLRRSWGRIVFISSESAVQIPAEMIHYGMTKTAQLAVARGLAELSAGTGVTVNSVLAGPTRSEGVATFVEDLAKQRGLSTAQVEEEFFKHVRPSSLLKRFETPDEVAAAVVYLCGAPASATNGAAVRADGGVVRSIL